MQCSFFKISTIHNFSTQVTTHTKIKNQNWAITETNMVKGEKGGQTKIKYQLKFCCKVPFKMKLDIFEKKKEWD